MNVQLRVNRDPQLITDNVKVIAVPIYELDIIVHIESDFNVANDLYGLNLKEDYTEGEDINRPYAWSVNACDKSKPSRGTIYLLLKPEHLDYNTILHELMHIIMMICTERGIEPDPANDEPITYLQGWVGEHILNFTDEYKKKNLV